MVGNCLCIANKVAILWRSKTTSFLYNSGLAWFPFPLFPPPSALSFNLAVEEEGKIICSVLGDSFDLHFLAFLSLPAFFFFSFFLLTIQRLFLTLEGVMLLASWEISVLFPFSPNRLLQIPLLLRFYLASKHLMTMLFHPYNNILNSLTVHIFLSPFTERSASVVFTAVHGLEPKRSISLV